MKIAALQEYLKDQNLAGSQSYEVLEKFLLYAKLVQDPLNVFRYMEEKSICIYFPLFWFTKSEYLAQIGDYRNAFLCLKEAEDRKQIQDNDQRVKILNTQMKAQIYKEQISNEMIKYPPNKRRTVSDFTIITTKSQDLPGTEEQKNEKLFSLLQTKFPVLKLEKEKAFVHKNQSKPRSWLFQDYEKQQMKMFQIITESFHMNNSDGGDSVPKQSVIRNATIQNQERMFKSVNTPFKRRDAMRMVKTLDSVEMMKRKRKSEDMVKPKKIYIASNDDLEEKSDEDQNEQEDSISLSMNTVPVGKAFEKKKRQVKFENPKQVPLKIQRPRDNNHITKEDDKLEAPRKTPTQKGILRNKSVEKKEFKIPDFSTINERSLKIKKTEETQI